MLPALFAADGSPKGGGGRGRGKLTPIRKKINEINKKINQIYPKAEARHRRFPVLALLFQHGEAACEDRAQLIVGSQGRLCHRGHVSAFSAGDQSNARIPVRVSYGLIFDLPHHCFDCAIVFPRLGG